MHTGGLLDTAQSIWCVWNESTKRLFICAGVGRMQSCRTACYGAGNLARSEIWYSHQGWVAIPVLPVILSYMSIELFRLEFWTGRCEGASVLHKRVCVCACVMLGAARPLGVVVVGGAAVLYGGVLASRCA